MENFKFNPQMDYLMTKVGIVNADSKYFSEGDQVTGKLALQTVGDYTMLLVNTGDNLIRTSPIVEVTEHNGNFTIKTANSIYTLERVQ